MKMYKILAVTLIAASISCNSMPAYSQVETIVATAFAAKKVSDIIEQFKRTGSQLLDQANSTGNALISRGANESNILAQNISFILRDRINDTFDQLDERQRKLLIESEKIRQELSKIVPGVYDIKDTMALDLAALVSSLPFVQRTFFVQAIHGLAYMPETGDLDIRILASTLGQQEGEKTSISMSIEGKDTALVRVNQSERRGQAVVTVPKSALDKFFKNNELSIVNAVLSFEVERDRPRWLGGPYKTTFPVPVHIALYPSLAANISITAKKAIYGWKDIGNKSDAIDTPNRHCSSNCRGQPTRGPNSIQFSVAGGAPPPKPGFQRLKNPDLRCSGASCPFSHVHEVTITDNGTRAYANFDTWSDPSHWTLTANVEIWDVAAVEDVIVPSKPVGYDRLYREEVPSDITAAILSVKTFTGKQYELELGKPDPNGIIEYQSMSELGNGNSVLLYRALPPQKVAR